MGCAGIAAAAAEAVGFAGIVAAAEFAAAEPVAAGTESAGADVMKSEMMDAAGQQVCPGPACCCAGHIQECYRASPSQLEWVVLFGGGASGKGLC